MTQSQRILRHLEDYGSITQMDAIQDYGIMRLASRIDELRQKGVPIVTECIKGKNRYGEPTRYGRYRLGVR